MQVTWTNQEDQLILSDFLKEKGLSRRFLTKLKQVKGAIRVNHQPVWVTWKLVKGDRVEVDLPKEEANPHLAPYEGGLDIIYEDDYLLALNKPAPQTCLPSPQNRTSSLANRVLAYYLKEGAENLKIHPVTRLDKETSGIILFAKHQYIHHLMTNWSNLTKKYLALVQGRVTPAEGVIDQAIGRAEDSIIKRQVKQGGKPAQTSYRVLDQSNQASMLAIDLLTGRTHQIRVHLSHLGHPLLGDSLYGGQPGIIDRQALHCQQVDFTHPLTGQAVRLQAPLPEDLLVLMQKLGLAGPETP